MWHNPQSSPRVMRLGCAVLPPVAPRGVIIFFYPPALAGFATRQGPLPTRTCCACKWHSADGPASNDLIRRVQSRRIRPHPWRRDHAHTMAVAKTKTSVHPLASDTTAAPGHRLTDANGKTDDDLRPSLLLPGGNP